MRDFRRRFSARPLILLSIAVAGIAIAGILIAGPAAARAQSAPADSSSATKVSSRVIRLSVAEGQVQVLRDQQIQFDQAFANMPLSQGDTVKTGGDGKAEMQFEDGSIARLTPGSELRFAELSGDRSGHLKSNVQLLSGEAYFEVRPAKGDETTIYAGQQEISVKDRGSFRVDLTRNPGSIAVGDGEIHVKDSSSATADVRANQTLVLDPNDASQMAINEGVETDTWDQWNEDRDQFTAKQQDYATGMQSGDNSAGQDDLDYYGSYYPVPGYGPVWQPYGIDASWDPFDAGYWGYYPGWGSTWISAYSWGWAPFHCGYWNYFGGFGWGWVGGGCGVGIWYPISPYYNAPGWWRAPIHPVRPNPSGHVRHLVPVGLVATGKWHPVAEPVRTPRAVTIAGHDIRPIEPLPVSVRQSGLANSAKPSVSGFREEPQEPRNRTEGEAGHPTPGSAAPVWHGGSTYSHPAPQAHYSAPAPSGGGHTSSGGGGSSSGGSHSSGSSSSGGGGSHK